MIGDLLGIGWMDLKKAEDMYSKIPSCVDLPEIASIPYGFDFCGWLFQRVAETLYKLHNIKVRVNWNYSASNFDYSPETQTKLLSLHSHDNNELAEFVLCH